MSSDVKQTEPLAWALHSFNGCFFREHVFTDASTNGSGFCSLISDPGTRRQPSSIKGHVHQGFAQQKGPDAGDETRESQVVNTKGK